MITYRQFNIEDVTKVLKMWKETPGVRLHDNSEDSQDGIERMLIRNEGLSFVAEDNGNIIAAILNGQDGRRGYIYHLVVKPEYRKQGIATKLIEMTKEKMLEEKIYKLALFVLKDNSSARTFYRKIGWSEVQEALAYSQVIKNRD